MKLVWIASYPKSGNTWLRAFLMHLLWGLERDLTLNDLGTYFASTTARQWYDLAHGAATGALSTQDILGLRHAALKTMGEDHGGVVFAKTHAPLVAWGSAPAQHMMPPDLTGGALYIVRNPLDIVPSAAHHYGVSLDDMIDLMASESFATENTPAHVSEPIGPWHAHVGNWTQGAKRLPSSSRPIPQVLRYEDMHADPRHIFSLVASYLNIDVPRSRLKRAIRNASFNTLRDQEFTMGFNERSAHAEQFFRYGRPGAGRATLSDTQIAQVIATQGPQMRRCGYLSHADGQD